MKSLKLIGIMICGLFMWACPQNPDVGNGTQKDNNTAKAEKAVVSVMLSQDNVQLDVDESAELTYTVEPSDGKIVSAVWSSDSEGIAVDNGLITGVGAGASGTVSLTITTLDGKTVSDRCLVTVANIPRIITRASNTYTLIQAYDFNSAEDGADLQGKGDIWANPAQFTGNIEEGLLKVTYPAGSSKLQGALAYTFEWDGASETDYLEVKLKMENTDLKTTLNLGVAGDDLQKGWERDLIYSGAGGGFGSGWGFRDVNGSGSASLAYSIEADTWKLLGMSIGETLGSLFFVDNGETETIMTKGGSALAKGNSYSLYFAMDDAGAAFPGNTVTVDYIAFYKLDENAVILPPGDTLKFFDEVKTAHVVDADNVEKDAEYDLLSGADAFKTYYAEEFDGTVSDLMQKTLPSGNKAWAEDRTWNVSSWEPAIKIQDSNLILNIYKIDVNNTAHKEIAGDTGRQSLIKGRADCVVGGINFGEMMLYGYAEARIKIPEHKYSGFWSGFYTYGTKPVSGKDEIGHEIDIFETVRDSEAHQILHFPKGDGRFGCSRVNYHYNWRNQFDSQGYIKAAVAWTPEKLVFYINDRITDTIRNEGSILSNLKAQLSGSGYDENEIPVVPNIAQKIFLVIASNENMSYYGGSVSARTGLQNEQTAPFVYYDSFKIYKYVGRIK